MKAAKMFVQIFHHNHVVARLAHLSHPRVAAFAVKFLVVM
jgi:hypothetical protein